MTTKIQIVNEIENLPDSILENLHIYIKQLSKQAHQNAIKNNATLSSKLEQFLNTSLFKNRPTHLAKEIEEQIQAERNAWD